MIFNANNLNSVLRNFGMGLPTGSIDDLSSHFEGGFFNRETFDKSFAPDMDATAKKNLGDALNFGFGKNSKNYTEEALSNAGNAYRRNGQVGLGTFATPTHSSSQLMDLMGSSAMGAAFGGAAIGGIVGAAMGNDPGESAVFGGVAGAAMFGLGRGLRSGAFMESVERRAISSIMGKSHDELVADKQAVYRGRLEGEVERNREIVQRETQKSMNNEEKERLIRQQGTPEQKLIDEEARAFDQNKEMGRNQFVGIDRRTNQPVTKADYERMPEDEASNIFKVDENVSREEYMKQRQLSGGDFSTEELGAMAQLEQNFTDANKLRFEESLQKGPDLPVGPDIVVNRSLNEQKTAEIELGRQPKLVATADEAFDDASLEMKQEYKNPLQEEFEQAKQKVKEERINDSYKKEYGDEDGYEHYLDRTRDIENTTSPENEAYKLEAVQGKNPIDNQEQNLINSGLDPNTTIPLSNSKVTYAKYNPSATATEEAPLFHDGSTSYNKFSPRKLEESEKSNIVSQKEHVLREDSTFEKEERHPLDSDDKTIIEETPEDINFANRQALLNFQPEQIKDYNKLSLDEQSKIEKELYDEHMSKYESNLNEYESKKPSFDESKENDKGYIEQYNKEFEEWKTKRPEISKFDPKQLYDKKYQQQINPRQALNKAYNSEYDTIIQSQKAAKEAEERYQKTASSMNVDPIGMDTIGLKKLDENGRVLPSIKLDYEKYPEERELQSGSGLNRFNSKNPQHGRDLINERNAEYEVTQDQVQQNINERGLTGEVSREDRMNIRESEHEEGMGLIRNLLAHDQKFNRTRLEGPPETQSIEFVNNGQTTRKLNDNETLIPIENSNYSFVGEKSDLNLSASAAIRMFDAQNVLRPKNFDNVSRPLANKELLQEAATAPTTSFMGKQAQKLLRSGPDHNIGMQTRHMVLGGSMLAGAAFGSKRKDHSRGFNSHRGNRI